MDYNHSPQSVQELEQMATELVKEMMGPLKGRAGNHGVILHALMLMHRQVVRSMSPQAQREIGYGLAGYAGHLISAPEARLMRTHAPHQFPTDLPTAIQ